MRVLTGGNAGSQFEPRLGSNARHPAQDRAYAISYNRLFITREGTSPAAGAKDYLFGADYAAIF